MNKYLDVFSQRAKDFVMLKSYEGYISLIFFLQINFLKHAVLSSNLVPAMLTIAFCTAFGALKFQTFLGQNAPGPTLPPPLEEN